jgi:hypothetical protein
MLLLTWQITGTLTLLRGQASLQKLAQLLSQLFLSGFTADTVAISAPLIWGRYDTPNISIEQKLLVLRRQQLVIALHLLECRLIKKVLARVQLILRHLLRWLDYKISHPRHVVLVLRCLHLPLALWLAHLAHLTGLHLDLRRMLLNSGPDGVRRLLRGEAVI